MHIFVAVKKHVRISTVCSMVVFVSDEKLFSPHLMRCHFSIVQSDNSSYFTCVKRFWLCELTCNSDQTAVHPIVLKNHGNSYLIARTRIPGYSDLNRASTWYFKYVGLNRLEEPTVSRLEWLVKAHLLSCSLHRQQNCKIATLLKIMLHPIWLVWNSYFGLPDRTPTDNIKRCSYQEWQIITWVTAF